MSSTPVVRADALRPESAPIATDFLAGGGALAALIRSHDWSRTPIGPPEQWPQSLKTTTAILLRSPVPIVLLWGPDGIMIYNDAYAVFGAGRHPALLGSKVLEGWPEVADFNANVMRVGLSGGTLTYRDQHLILHRHGQPEDVWLNLDYSPVLDESGKPAGVLAIVVETTERVAAEQRLREANKAAQREIERRTRIEAMLDESSRRKDEFLAMLAHELRNPLAPIANATELLARVASNDERSQTAVGMIKRQMTQLTRLVDDLLDVSRITQGLIQLRKQPVEVSSIITQAIETVEPQLREKRHRLSVTTSGHQTLYVQGDFARLVQCVGNLLSNAAKYTEPGGEISVRTHGDAAQVFIEVVDTGVGIPPTLLPAVFDLFVQSERTLDRAQGGLGIGLAVVKRIIEMHDGEVSARSEGHGRGSSFTIRLPRIAQVAEKASVVASFKAAPRRVLIVDDNVDAANSLSMLLSLQGHETQVAYDAHEALSQVSSFRPDAALLDIGLPGMDGYELARRLRALTGSNGLRLLALTGYGQAEDASRAHAAGFDGHLVKPVELSVLERMLAG